MTRAAHAPLRPQVVQQLFFQCSPGLNEQATVNRFVGHAQALVVGILVLQPPGNLLGRPVQDQSTRNDVPQLAVLGKQAALRTQGRNPSLLICIMGTIGRSATMASDLPAHGGGRSIQASRYLTNRGTRSDPSGDVLSLRHGKRPSRAAAECWSNPSARQQHSANTAVRLVKSAPNLMQRLSCLPAAPNVTLLDRRKPKPHPSSHANTTFTEQIYIRWCCIDLSNAPRQSGSIAPCDLSARSVANAGIKWRSSLEWSVYEFENMGSDQHSSFGPGRWNVLGTMARVEPVHAYIQAGSLSRYRGPHEPKYGIRHEHSDPGCTVVDSSGSVLLVQQTLPHFLFD